MSLMNSERPNTHWNQNVVILTKFSSLAALKVVKMIIFSAANDKNYQNGDIFVPVLLIQLQQKTPNKTVCIFHGVYCMSLWIDLIHKSHSAPVPYPTMLHSEQKCAHFCSEWSIVEYGTGAFWDFVKLVYWDMRMCLARPEGKLGCNSTYTLTHWGRATHICVGNLTIIGSDNGLAPVAPFTNMV